MEELIRLYSEENLGRITEGVIRAYRERNWEQLFRLARRAGLKPEDYQGERGRLFKRLMATFHPDRTVHFHRMIRRYSGEGNRMALERMKKNISLVRLCDTRPPSPAPAGDEPVYHTDPSRINPEGESWGEYLDGEMTREETAREWGFIEAVRNMMYGNLFSEFLPKDLVYLEGMLDLPESEIEDLDGIGYCRNLTGLNLEGNRICRLDGLEELPYLTTLYLARNLIDDIEPLRTLTSLKSVDLSFNDIEDIGPLLDLPDLEYANLLGNPIRDGEALGRLRGRALVIAD